MFNLEVARTCHGLISGSKAALDHAEHWSCSGNGVQHFRTRDDGLQQINGPLEFVQRLRGSKAALDHADHWSCSGNGLQHFRPRDDGLQQINGPLEFVQRL